MTNGRLRRDLQQVADHLAGTESPRPTVVGVRSPAGDHIVAAAGPMTVDTPFHLASVGKVYTAVLLLQLVDMGVLDLDTPVADTGVLATAERETLHPWFSRITLRHLLSHTSGWRDIHMDDANEVADPSGRPAPGSFMRRYARSVAALARGDHDDFACRRWNMWDGNHPGDAEAGIMNRFLAEGYARHPLSEPGTRFHYSDTGYQLATLVLEHVGGAAYHRQQRERILQPLNLTSTAMAYGDDVDLLSLGSDVYLGDQALLALGCNLSFDYGGGGQMASVDDVLSFGGAVFSGALVGAESYRTMTGFTTPSGLVPPRHAVGVGLHQWSTPAGRVLEGHSGAWGARLFRDPATGWIVAGSSHRRDDGAWLDRVLDLVAATGVQP